MMFILDELATMIPSKIVKLSGIKCLRHNIDKAHRNTN